MKNTHSEHHKHDESMATVQQYIIARLAASSPTGVLVCVGEKLRIPVLVAADYNYDLELDGSGAAQLRFPVVANTSVFSLVAYVRYSREDTTSTFLAVCEAA